MEVLHLAHDNSRFLTFALTRHMSVPTWIFDLDDTLHQASLGIFAHISRMMNLYMERHLAMTEEEARRLRLQYWHRYGATLQGLVRHHGVDARHFLQETHLLDELYRWLVWEPALGTTLRTLPGRKIVLSNGPQHYIEGLLRRMHIRQQFAACYGMEKMRFQPKPDRRGFRCMLQAERLDPARCIMVEDSLANLYAAKSLGMRTVWVSRQSRKPAFVDVRVSKLSQLLRQRW
ncbi:pyrimidine 5'-nucleotidase [Aquitalea aquatilis]|uniref:pyrimidine 5'-nucleotidase n=1 Tax=Aquitalea aquatilis TaxID=1537400 RepID=UPI001FEA6DF7|nr:pyrimidine 5'-nucleotidase [Aquitalea aquatilis]